MKAGFQVLRIISEPTAACLEYGMFCSMCKYDAIC